MEGRDIVDGQKRIVILAEADLVAVDAVVGVLGGELGNGTAEGGPCSML